MHKWLIILFLIVLSQSLVLSQEIQWLPEKKTISYGRCKGDSSFIKILLRQASEDGYQTGSGYNNNVQLIDLNGDGLCEYILKYSDGGAYIFDEIYSVNDGRLSKIGVFAEGFYSFAEQENGWDQIINHYYSGHKTNPIWYFSVYRYNGDKYEVVYDPKQTYGELKNLGLEKYNLGDYKKAEIYFENILKGFLNTTVVDVNNLALALMAQGDFEHAKGLLKYDLTKRESAITYFNLSLIAKHKNDLHEELEYLKLSNLLEPTLSKKNKINELKKKLGHENKSVIPNQEISPSLQSGEFKDHRNVIKNGAFIFLSCYSFIVGVLLLRKKRNQTSPVGFNFIWLVTMIFCFWLSGFVIGIQNHDERNFAMNTFGPPMWIITAGLIYPIAFLGFIFSLSKLKSFTIDLVTLLAWILFVFGIAYFVNFVPNDIIGEDYDSLYFPSESKLLPPMIMFSVLLLLIVIIFKKHYPFQIFGKKN